MLLRLFAERMLSGKPDMSGSSNFGDEKRQTELTSFVMREVQRILAQCNEAKQGEKATVGPSGSSANDLTASAAEFLSRLEAEAARRLNAQACESASPSRPAERPLGHPGLEDCLREGARIAEWAGPVAGSTHLERRFGIPRSTLYWWQRHNDVVAFRRGSRKHVFPLAQFIDGRPIPGIRLVLSSISDPRIAWLWLISPSPLLKGRVPIELLREGMSIDVASAAQALSLIESL
ncbi:antitoxin Xre/MbcA/ParS-like domain-containing protein [Bradyrhizobium sp. Arg314]